MYYSVLVLFYLSCATVTVSAVLSNTSFVTIWRKLEMMFVGVELR